MISAEYLDKLDFMAKRYREDANPFGGIQMIFAGDYLQLAPVTGHFAFQANSWKSARIIPIILTWVYRQQDETFRNILGALRFGKVSDDHNHILNALDREVESESSFPTRLYSTRAEVETLNNEKINLILGDLKEYESEVFIKISFQDTRGSKDTLNKNILASSKLRIKIGCRVLLIKNLVTNRMLVNGTQGVVLNATDHCITVRFENIGTPVDIVREDFEYTSEVLKLHKRTQFPLILAYALTIHKAQGMTLDFVEVDLQNAFVDGQVYVALSRCTSLHGLYIRNYDRSKVMANFEVVDFYKALDI